MSRSTVEPWLCLCLGFLLVVPILGCQADGAGGDEDAAQAPTFYVSPTGSNDNPGTRELPWATPGFGSKQLRPGNTLVILPGEYLMTHYYDDMVTPEVSGTAEAWITIRGEAAAPPIIRGRGSLMAAVDIGGRSYIRLENLVLTGHIDEPYTGGLREGIDAGGSSGTGVSHVVLENIEVHRVEECAINFGGNISDVRMERLRLHHTGGTGISAPGAEGGNGWERVLLTDSYVGYAGHFWQGEDRLSEWDRPDGIGMEPSAGPLEIANCLFAHNRGDGVDSKCRQTYVHDTIIANNYADSLKFWGDGSRAENVLIYGDGDGEADNGPWASIVVHAEQPGSFEFVNVTVDDNATRSNYPVYMQYGETVPVTVTLRNCIIAHGSNVIYMEDSVTLDARHCLFARTGDAGRPVIHANGRDYLPAEVGLLGAGNLSAEPQFVSRAWGTEGDYHLRPGSPAVDAGTATGAPAADLEGTPRPQGAGVDMGAYER